jgi:hypothetical protein
MALLFLLSVGIYQIYARNQEGRDGDKRIVNGQLKSDHAPRAANHALKRTGYGLKSCLGGGEQ